MTAFKRTKNENENKKMHLKKPETFWNQVISKTTFLRQKTFSVFFNINYASEYFNQNIHKTPRILYLTHLLSLASFYTL